MSQKPIDLLVSQLNDIARTQVEFMNYFPDFADEIVSGLATFLGEGDCIKLSNSQDEFSFDEDYGHSGLGVDSGRFCIPLMLRIRDHNSCASEEEQAETDKKSGKKKKAKKARKAKKIKAAATARAKTKTQELPSKKSSKAEKPAKSKKPKAKKAKRKKKKMPELDCNETFLRFKLLCERKEAQVVVDIAGKKTVTVDRDNLTPLYEAIFVYLTDYFSPKSFFDKQSQGYQNASYGFFRKAF